MIPLQGIAAGMRMACAAGHGFAPSAEAGGRAKLPEASLHEHQSGMAGDEMPATPELHNDAGPSSVEHSNHHKNFSCSNCGSCCIGALALPVSLNMSLIDIKMSVAIISPAALVTGFIPDGLERPPRKISA